SGACPFRSRLPSSRKFLKTLSAQLARRAFAAAVTPVVALGAVPQITAMALLDDEIKKCFSADVLRHGKGVGFVDPHQGSMDADTLVEAERQRDLHGLDRVVAAVRITGIVGFTHASDQMAGAAPISHCAGKAEENEIAARHEGRRQAGLGDRDSCVACQCGLRNGSKRIELDYVIIAQTRFPGTVQGRHALADACPYREFDGVPLAVVETNRLDARETLQRPGEANCRVLPAREENKCSIG